MILEITWFYPPLQIRTLNPGIKALDQISIYAKQIPLLVLLKWISFILFVINMSRILLTCRMLWIGVEAYSTNNVKTYVLLKPKKFLSTARSLSYYDFPPTASFYCQNIAVSKQACSLCWTWGSDRTQFLSFYPWASHL